MGPRSFERGDDNRKERQRMFYMTFNGAALFRARRLRHPGNPPGGTLPSMGPRSFERGDVCALPDGSGCVQPSMGPRSFERGDAPPPIPAQGVLTLQWGRALSSAETVWRRRTTDNGQQPSMGPRSFERGDLGFLFLTTCCHTTFNGAALFRARRPWFSFSNNLLSHNLQWGRALSSAETRLPLSARMACGSLQWGRALSSAETYRTTTTPLPPLPPSMGPRSFERGDP